MSADNSRSPSKAASVSRSLSPAEAPAVEDAPVAATGEDVPAVPEVPVAPATTAPTAAVPAAKGHPEGVKLCLRGLPSTHAVEKDEILAFFGDDASSIPFVWVARNPPGFAFVRYNGSEDPAAFAARYNEKPLNGVPVLVSIEVPAREQQGVKLIVRGLPTQQPIDPKEILAFFGEAASQIENVWVARNPPGFAFVRYTGSENAVEFASRFNDRTLGDAPVQVDVSSQPDKRNRDGPGGRGRGGGHRSERGGFGRGGSGGGYGGYGRGGGGYGGSDRYDDRRGPSDGYRQERRFDDRRDDRRYDDRRDDRRYDDRRGPSDGYRREERRFDDRR